MAKWVMPLTQPSIFLCLGSGDEWVHSCYTHNYACMFQECSSLIKYGFCVESDWAKRDPSDLCSMREKRRGGGGHTWTNRRYTCVFTPNDCSCFKSILNSLCRYRKTKDKFVLLSKGALCWVVPYGIRQECHKYKYDWCCLSACHIHMISLRCNRK